MGFQSGFRINTNTSAVNTYRSYSSAQAGLERNIERLSSGLRINRAADDSAGLAISQRMNNQIKGMQQANRNVQQGNNMLQTAEGGLNQIHSILGRMRELAVQSASDGLNADDRASIDLEFQQLKSEISRIGNGTEYNGMTLINGDRAKNLTTEDNSIGGNMVNDSTIGKTKMASFAANGSYTLQAEKADGSSTSAQP
jgi:flagellin